MAGLPAQIADQLAEIERRISDLVAVRDGLIRVYMRVSGQRMEIEDPAGADTNCRMNSYHRLMIEGEILDALRATQNSGLATRELFDRACVSNPKLKYNTFRSYLTRLRKRNLVVCEDGQRGFWSLPAEVAGRFRTRALATEG
jgi:hypothetical protein